MGVGTTVIQAFTIVLQAILRFAMATTLNTSLHVKYIQDLGKSDDELVYHLTSHLRLNAIYWGLMALCIMGHKDALDRDEMIEFVMSCWDDEAGTFLNIAVNLNLELMCV